MADPIPLVELGLREGPEREAIDDAIRRVIDSQRFILGPEVDAFEAAFAARLGINVRAVGVSNGSDALILALMALGIGPGDEVIVPAMTFVSTGSAVRLVGAQPVFVDVRPDDVCLDPDALAARVGPRTRAVMAVHLYGRAADVPAIGRSLAAAGASRVTVIEDAAQAQGAYLDDSPVGTLASIACFSFFPTKNLASIGDAGLVATSDDALCERLVRLRNHGRTGRHDADLLGLNARLGALQAAVLRARLPFLSEHLATRRANAQRYVDALRPLEAAGHVVLPPADASPLIRPRHTYNVFSIRVRARRRDALREHLADAGIATAVYYPTTVPQMPCFADIVDSAQSFPCAEAAAAESLALPVSPGLTRPEQERVCAALIDFFEGHR